MYFLFARDFVYASAVGGDRIIYSKTFDLLKWKTGVWTTGRNYNFYTLFCCFFDSLFTFRGDDTFIVEKCTIEI